jgi:AraC-like DNA-binding protein
MVEGASAEAKSLSDRVILCIHHNLHRSLTPGQLAEELRVSLRTLQRVLAATLDCTPRQLIFAMKMRAARRLLLSGDYRVNEVAYRLGFSSPGHFSTRFRSFYRMPPSRLLRSTRDLHTGPKRDEDTGVVN